MASEDSCPCGHCPECSPPTSTPFPLRHISPARGPGALLTYVWLPGLPHWICPLGAGPAVLSPRVPSTEDRVRFTAGAHQIILRDKNRCPISCVTLSNPELQSIILVFLNLWGTWRAPEKPGSPASPTGALSASMVCVSTQAEVAAGSLREGPSKTECFRGGALSMLVCAQ